MTVLISLASKFSREWLKPGEEDLVQRFDPSSDLDTIGFFIAKFSVGPKNIRVECDAKSGNRWFGSEITLTSMILVQASPCCQQHAGMWVAELVNVTVNAR